MDPSDKFAITEKLTLTPGATVIAVDQTIPDVTSDKLALADVKSELLKKSDHVDKSLAPMIEAEFSKMISALEKIESKLIKAEKSKDDSLGNKITKLQEKLFPGKHLQERQDNFLPYYLNSSDFISTIISEMKFEDQPKVRIVIR